MKLSFSLTSRSSSSRNPTARTPQTFISPGDRGLEDSCHDEAKPHFVTVFDPSENPSSISSSQRVITPAPNYDHRSYSKSKILPLPTADDPPTETRFVLDTSGGNGSDASRYGLTLRSNGTEAKSEEIDPRISDKRNFQESLKELPDDVPPDFPIEGFGAAILAGSGWVEGKPIGRNCKLDPKVFEHKRRAGTEGFGYVPQPPDSPKKSQKVKKAASPPKSNIDKEDRYTEVRGERNSDIRKKAKKMHDTSSTTSDEKNIICSIQWLRNHIRVRIISKKVGGGKLYLKKGEIVDVVGPTTCDIRMDESGELYQGVEQRYLETALPKRGGFVLVLYGKHKGVYGSLVERDNEKEMGMVRDADSHALINVIFEQIAEYVGDPSYLGY